MVAEPENDRKMTVGEHLEEFRRRLIYALVGLALAMGVSLFFGKELLLWIQGPYREAMKEVGRDPQLTVLTIQGGFSTYLRVTFLAGLAVSSLWVFYQLWMFVAVGLRRRERRYVVGAVPVSVLLFVLGAAFFLELVAIPAIKFLTWFNVTWLQSAQIITLQDYIDFVIDMMLICGLVFQMPLVVLVLARLHIVTMKGLHYYRRHVIVAIFVFTGIFAPPDPVSQLVMSAPMLVLYEVGVLAAYFMVFRKQPKDGS